MPRLYGNVFIIFLLFSGNVYSNGGGVDCLRDQINSNGFEVEQNEDVVYENVFKMAKEFKVDVPSGLKLGPKTALAFCRLFGTSGENFKKSWPSNKSHFYMDSDNDVRSDLASYVGEAISKIIDNLRDEYKFEFALPVHLFVFHDKNSLKQALARHIDAQYIDNNFERLYRASCVGKAVCGFVIGSSLSIIVKEQVYVRDYGFEDMNSRDIAALKATLRHEMFHVMQLELAGFNLTDASTKNWLDLYGPMWLVEGSAMLFSDISMEDGGEIDEVALKSMIDWAYGQYGLSVDMFSSVMGYGDVDGIQQIHLYQAEIVSYMLRQTYGFNAIIAFYEDLGNGHGWEASFMKNFHHSYIELQNSSVDLINAL